MRTFNKLSEMTPEELEIVATKLLETDGTLTLNRAMMLYKPKFLELYGNKCSCCGEEHREFLALDHINGLVGVERPTTASYYKDAVVNYDANKYRILCHNCNSAYGYFGYCPHSDNHTTKLYAGLDNKLQAIDILGGKCACCGESRYEFLCIVWLSSEYQYITGITSYKMVISGLTDNCMLLCHNCNMSDAFYGYCPH